MNKAQLIDEVSNKTNIGKKQTSEVISEFMEVIKKSLKKGDKVTLVGFGTFQVRNRKATTGVNPRTKEKINIPAKKVAKLQFSDVVNDLLNNK